MSHTLQSHWKDVNDPIQIPELREDPDATTNYVTCNNFVKTTVKSPTGDDVLQWHCGKDNDEWAEMEGQDLTDLKDSLKGLSLFDIVSFDLIFSIGHIVPMDR